MSIYTLQIALITTRNPIAIRYNTLTIYYSERDTKSDRISHNRNRKAGKFCTKHFQ